MFSLASILIFNILVFKNKIMFAFLVSNRPLSTSHISFDVSQSLMCGMIQVDIGGHPPIPTGSS
jgi:hypothetical protein